jgi:arsenite-transporting ATPase
MRTIFFTGKGGVGKTTLAAATALRSAALGYKTLVISTDAAHSLADSLRESLSGEPRLVGPPGLYAAELDTAEELERYWGSIRQRIAGFLREQGVSPLVAGELAILPGMDEVLALVRIKQFHDRQEYDVLVVDSAPTGGAMRLLSAPHLNAVYSRHLLGLSAGLAGMVWPAIRSRIRVPISEDRVREQIQHLLDEIDNVQAVLTDEERTSVRLVLTPETLALRETQRAYTFMSLYGLHVDTVLVNRILPEETDDPFYARWQARQAGIREEIHREFEPLPVLDVPLMPDEVTGLDALAELAEALYGDRDPVMRQSTAQPMRFYVEDGRHMLAIRLMGVSRGAIDLQKEGEELRVRLGRFRRTIILPPSVAGMQPAWARMDDNTLLVAFQHKTIEPVAL